MENFILDISFCKLKEETVRLVYIGICCLFSFDISFLFSGSFCTNTFFVFVCFFYISLTTRRLIWRNPSLIYNHISTSQISFFMEIIYSTLYPLGISLSLTQGYYNHLAKKTYYAPLLWDKFQSLDHQNYVSDYPWDHSLLPHLQNSLEMVVLSVGPQHSLDFFDLYV